MKPIKPIRTTDDHRQALAEIERLLDTAKKGTLEGDRLEILLTLAHDYERKRIALPLLDPIEAILFRMDQLGLAKKDLGAIFKTSGRTSEIIEKKRALNLNMIRKLHSTMNIPIEVLVQEYQLKKAKPPGKQTGKKR